MKSTLFQTLIVVTLSIITITVAFALVAAAPDIPQGPLAAYGAVFATGYGLAFLIHRR